MESKATYSIASFSNSDQLDQEHEVTDDVLESNKEQTEQEIESLNSILNSQECQILELDQNIAITSEKYLPKLETLIQLSLVPTCTKKFLLIDKPKDIVFEVRSLPALELFVCIPKFYPSNQKPLLLLKPGSFYEPLKEHLYEELNSKWSEDMLVLYEYVCYIQDDFLNSYFEKGEIWEKMELNSDGNVEIKYDSSLVFQKIFDQCVEAQSRSFNSEEHLCKVCCKNYLGDKFFFLSGCSHYFCKECMKEMITFKINNMQINQITCPESTCKKNLNDLDIRNLKLPQNLLEKYEQFSLSNAIAQMDDLGWCPLPGCGSLANIDKEINQGKCQHCDFVFCLDCKERHHPFKRCLVNRLDLLDLISNEEKENINSRNKKAEAALNEIFFKYCAKFCPNTKCGIKIQKMESGCTQMQCPKCFHYFCWVCLHNAKGQKHYKERPQCLEEQGTLQPEELTQELKLKHLGEQEDYINLKFCAKCPHCGGINEKRTRSNAFTCVKCEKMFCYICNKAIAGLEHYKKSNCHIESDPYADF